MATRMVYSSIEDEEQSPRVGPFLVVTVESSPRLDMAEEGVDRVEKNATLGICDLLEGLGLGKNMSRAVVGNRIEPSTNTSNSLVRHFRKNPEGIGSWVCCGFSLVL